MIFYEHDIEKLNQTHVFQVSVSDILQHATSNYFDLPDMTCWLQTLTLNGYQFFSDTIPSRSSLPNDMNSIGKSPTPQ